MQHYSDYLREQAAKYRLLADTAEDASVKQEFLELAAVCEEVANEIAGTPAFRMPSQTRSRCRR